MTRVAKGTIPLVQGHRLAMTATPTLTLLSVSLFLFGINVKSKREGSKITSWEIRRHFLGIDGVLQELRSAVSEPQLLASGCWGAPA